MNTWTSIGALTLAPLAIGASMTEALARFARMPLPRRALVRLPAIAGCALLLLPPPAFGAFSATSVKAGAGYTCALTAAGGVKCWGSNAAGQLGDGTTIDRLTPVDVAGLTSGVTAIATGTYSACALTSGGGVKCWGGNDRGQLGDGTTTDRSTPADVTGLGSGVTALGVGANYACALGADTSLRCWGANTAAQFGNDSLTDSLTPVVAAYSLSLGGPLGAIDEIAIGFGHACARDSSDDLYCWGANSVGQLGLGYVSAPISTAQLLPSQLSSLAAGVTATCALGISTGGAFCWGYNGAGQVGDGTTVDRSSPVAVSGLSSGVAAITTSGVHACARTTGGAVKCWGANSSGSVGDGTTIDRHTPVDVSGLASGVRDVSAGGLLIWHTCAVMDDGGVKCWGDNGLGQLGDGTTTDRTTPTSVVSTDNDCSAMSKPKLTLTRMNTPPGDDGLSLSGDLVRVPQPGDPAIDPRANGVRLSILRNSPAGPVLDDVVIPAGGYDKTTKKGWKANGKLTVFTYLNGPNDLPTKIYRAQVKVDARTPGLVKFSVKGKKGDFSVVPGEIPVTVSFSLEPSYAQHGQCSVERFENTFPLKPSCFFNGKASTLTCR